MMFEAELGLILVWAVPKFVINPTIDECEHKGVSTRFPSFLGICFTITTAWIVLSNLFHIFINLFFYGKYPDLSFDFWSFRWSIVTMYLLVACALRVHFLVSSKLIPKTTKLKSVSQSQFELFISNCKNYNLLEISFDDGTGKPGIMKIRPEQGYGPLELDEYNYKAFLVDENTQKATNEIPVNITVTGYARDNIAPAPKVRIVC